MEVLKKPYIRQNKISKFQLPKKNIDKKYQTFCGT